MQIKHVAKEENNTFASLFRNEHAVLFSWGCCTTAAVSPKPPTLSKDGNVIVKIEKKVGNIFLWKF